MHNCAFMHNCYSNCAYMHGYCSMCIYYFINFRSHLFFSLFSLHNQWTQFSSPHLLFSQMHTNKHTHTHTQTNPHGQTNKETDRSSWVLIDAWSELMGPDWCLTRAHRSWSLLDWSFVLIGACGTIRARGSFAWTELDRDGSCLIGAREIWPRGRVNLCWYRDGTCWRLLLEMGRDRATNRKMGREREKARV